LLTEIEFLVLPEYVQEAEEKTDQKLSDEDVTMLPEDGKYVLLALARCLRGRQPSISLWRRLKAPTTLL